MTIILAEVKRRIEGEDGRAAGFALLTPIYLADQGSWGPIMDLERRFPHKGEVVWWKTYGKISSQNTSRRKRLGRGARSKNPK